jgi:beta-galactosidase
VIFLLTAVFLHRQVLHQSLITCSAGRAQEEDEKASTVAALNGRITMSDSASVPRIPYGAVYFRKSNPPREDWARDYRTAAEDGMNTFRHWFLWSEIEVAPGEYDWVDYDAQLDLAAAHGIRTIIAEMITAAPEWAWRQLDHARIELADGRRLYPQMSGSCVTGGFPGLCLDHDEVRDAAGRFLTALAQRYREHPGLGGYDIWNECNYGGHACYCPATTAAFRRWLQEKYGDLRALGEAWFRHSFTGWEDVTPPRTRGPYPDTLDWLQFQVEHAYRWMRWRVDLIRAVDPDHPVTAHGIAGTLTSLAGSGADDWRAAAEVDSYGFTWVPSRQGDQPWKAYHAVDLARAACRGKSFWHAEAQAGPLWMQPQVHGRPREDGRITQPEDIRLWNMTSFAGGATGILYPRWRPLLDGPLFGAFGAYGMDGARTPRSEICSRMARWANAPEQEALWRSRPVQGDLGLLIVPEAQLFCYAQQGSAAYFAESLRGAYQAFFAHNIQADWMRLEQIDEYDLIYLPFPLMLTRDTADRLRTWVEAGGALVCEGCPAYFSDRGRAGARQPNLSLDRLFGVRETYVEFTPDLLDDLWVLIPGGSVRGGLFLQRYEAVARDAAFGGTPTGRYDDGSVAMVDHHFGRGRTRLIGTFPGYGRFHHPADDCSFFRDLLPWASKTQHVCTDDPHLAARLHQGEGGTYLWVTNPTRQPRTTVLTLSERWGPYAAGALLWGEGPLTVAERTVTLSVGARDAAVLRLDAM